MSYNRIYPIIIIDLIMLLLLIKVLFLDANSDTIGLFTILTSIFFLLYNLYAIVVLRLFFTGNRSIYAKIAYIIMLLLPIITLWYYTS